MATVGVRAAGAAVTDPIALNATAFLASFAFIALKAFQQLNVSHDQYWWVVPTSMLMAICEVWVIYNVAHSGWGWIVVWIGLGSGLGAVLAMWLHKRLRRARG